MFLSYAESRFFLKGNEVEGELRKKETSRKGAQERMIAWMNMIEVQYTYMCVYVYACCVCVYEHGIMKLAVLYDYFLKSKYSTRTFRDIFCNINILLLPLPPDLQ